jgi:hypothetical protein
VADEGAAPTTEVVVAHGDGDARTTTISNASGQDAASAPLCSPRIFPPPVVEIYPKVTVQAGLE